jgi:hypothetical protein
VHQAKLPLSDELQVNTMKKAFVFPAAALFAIACLTASVAHAKLPAAPQTEEAKAKAAEAAAKTAHGNKVEAFKLCKSMDKTAAHYFKTAAAAKKDVKPAAATPTATTCSPSLSVEISEPIASII